MFGNNDCPEFIVYSVMLFASSVTFVMPVYYYVTAFKKMQAWNAAFGKPDENDKFT